MTPLIATNRLLRLVLLVASVAVAPTVSIAESSGGQQGLISARAFAGLPKSAPIAVEYRDDTALNNRLLPFIERELEARGYTTRPSAPHVLFFARRVISRESDRTGLRLHGTGGNSDGIRHLDARIRMPWSTETRFRKATQYRLTLTLRKNAEPLLWEGSAVVRLRNRDWFRVQSALATELLDLVGQTEATRPLPLD